MDELNKTQKAAILQQKLAQANQQYYSHQVDAQVARDIGGMEQVLEAAQANMAQAQKVIDVLTRMLKELGDAEKS